MGSIYLKQATAGAQHCTLRSRIIPLLNWDQSRLDGGPRLSSRAAAKTTMDGWLEVENLLGAKISA